MTKRTKEISGVILAVLSGWDDPAPEAVIYGQVGARVQGLLVSEFDQAIYGCEAERWITGENDALKGRVWSITNRGLAASRK